METVACPSRSCSVVSSGGLANGTEPRWMALPSPRLRAKDVWVQGPETRREQPLSQNKSFGTRRDRGLKPWAPGGDGSQEQIWTSGRDPVGHFPPDQAWIPERGREEEGAGQAWMVGQTQGPEQDWVADGGQGRKQAWSADRDPAGGQGSSGSERVWGAVQNQEQTWRETSTDREHIWRPGGFLSSE